MNCVLATKRLSKLPFHQRLSCLSKSRAAIGAKAVHSKTTPSFGIIAALNKQNIIGINGSLPWKHLPQDIAHFVNMTRDKVLIIGRKSFTEEDPTGSHVEHVRACVVLSNTMDEDALVQLQNERGGPVLKVAKSFDRSQKAVDKEQ